MRNLANLAAYNVNGITFNGAIIVDYQYYLPNDNKRKRYVVSSLERPHEDLLKALENIKQAFYHMYGMPIVDIETGQKLDIIIKKIKFIEKDKNGRGMQIKADVIGIDQHEKETTLVTPPYYVSGLSDMPGSCVISGVKVQRRRQELSPLELEAMNTMEEEAMLFAYCGKKEQPTLEEAAELNATNFLGNK